MASAGTTAPHVDDVGGGGQVAPPNAEPAEHLLTPVGGLQPRKMDHPGLIDVLPKMMTDMPAIAVGLHPTCKDPHT